MFFKTLNWKKEHKNSKWWLDPRWRFFLFKILTKNISFMQQIFFQNFKMAHKSK
jgi:hypothetical protein